MNVRKTAKGWVIEITNTVHGCLEQGGICGREVLVTRDGLAKVGINYDDDPNKQIGDYQTPLWAIAKEFAAEQPGIQYARVLKRGHRIQ